MPGIPLTNTVPRIYHLRDPKLMPRYEFEWHEHTQKVYVIEFAVKEKDGQEHRTGPTLGAWCIAEHVEDYGRAYGMVQTFVRGYRLAKWGDKVGTR